MKLTDAFNTDILKYRGHELELDLSFDNILRIQELQSDENFRREDKVDIMYQMLVNNPKPMALIDKARVTQIVFNVFINEEGNDENKGRESLSENDDEKAEGSSNSNENIEKHFDFEQDAEAIYSSFIYDYGIDLIESQGKLHWKKFMALLGNLSDKTSFMKIVNIRTMEIPKQNKYNAKEIADIKKQKEKFKLIGKSNTDTVEEIDDKLNNFASSLRPKEVKKGGKV